MSKLIWNYYSARTHKKLTCDQIWECWRPIIHLNALHANKSMRKGTNCVISVFLLRTKNRFPLNIQSIQSAFFFIQSYKEPLKRSKQISAGSMFRFQFHFYVFFSCLSLFHSFAFIRLSVGEKRKDLTYFFPFFSSFFFLFLNYFFLEFRLLSQSKL